MAHSEESGSRDWRSRAKAIARAAFGLKRPHGHLAPLVQDSLVESGAAPDDHYLTFEHPGLTVRLHVAAMNDYTELSGRVDPAGSHTALLQSDRVEPILRSGSAGPGRFAFPPIGHGLVRMRFDSPNGPTIWSDWFRV